MIGKDQEWNKVTEFNGFKSPGLVKQISLRQAQFKLTQVVVVGKKRIFPTPLIPEIKVKTFHFIYTNI